MITLAFFFGELFRVNKQQVLQSLVLAAQIFVFNVLLLTGSAGMDPSVASFVMSVYFVFVPVCLLFFGKKVSRDTIIGGAIMLFGLMFSLGAGPAGFSDIRILLLLAADICFALYIVTIERFCVKSNPAVLAMGQMFFCFIFSSVGWAAELAITQTGFTLPNDAAFWSSVLFISFFIRGFYSVIQIYAQRFVSAMNTALIFSTDVVVSLLMSPFLVMLFGGVSEPITVFKSVGCALIIIGVVYADGSIAQLIRKRSAHAE